jgi:hypothetical protein
LNDPVGEELTSDGLNKQTTPPPSPSIGKKKKHVARKYGLYSLLFLGGMEKDGRKGTDAKLYMEQEQGEL